MGVGGRNMVQIVDHLTVDGLGERYRAARDATEARHFQAIWLLAQGRKVSEVAGLLAFVERWVELLVRPKAGQTEVVRYNRDGPDALGDLRRNNGRAASVLTPDLLAALAERAKTPPDDGAHRAHGAMGRVSRSRAGWLATTSSSACTVWSRSVVTLL